VAGLTAGKSLL